MYRGEVFYQCFIRFMLVNQKCSEVKVLTVVFEGKKVADPQDGHHRNKDKKQPPSEPLPPPEPMPDQRHSLMYGWMLPGYNPNPKKGETVRRSFILNSSMHTHIIRSNEIIIIIIASHENEMNDKYIDKLCTSNEVFSEMSEEI